MSCRGPDAVWVIRRVRPLHAATERSQQSSKAPVNVDLVLLQPFELLLWWLLVDQLLAALLLWLLLLLLLLR